MITLILVLSLDPPGKVGPCPRRLDHTHSDLDHFQGLGGGPFPAPGLPAGSAGAAAVGLAFFSLYLV